MAQVGSGFEISTEQYRRLATKEFTSRTPFLIPDPWPLYVRYEKGEATFVPRDVFYFSDPAGPSACLWIVPDSTKGG